MKGANFKEQLLSLGLTTSNYPEVERLLKGATIKILGNANSHSYGPIGTVFKATESVYSEDRTNHNSLRSEGGTIYGMIPGGNSIRLTDFVVVVELEMSDFEERIEELESNKSKLDDEIDLVKEKMAFLKSSGFQIFEPEAFKANKLLQISKDTSLTESERLVKITEALKNL